jgi:hypothetical protein
MVGYILFFGICAPLPSTSVNYQHVFDTKVDAILLDDELQLYIQYMAKHEIDTSLLLYWRRSMNSQQDGWNPKSHITSSPLAHMRENENLANSSTKCNLVRKVYANLPDTPVALTIASNFFQMFPAPLRALQRTLRLCKNILMCYWKHQVGWRCIQDATRLTNWIVTFWSCWDLSAGLRGTSRAAETSAQDLPETWCHILIPVVLRVS